MSVLRQLYSLQLLDGELDQADERLTGIRERLAATGEVARAQDVVSESEVALESLRKNLRALELEIGGIVSKLQANQERLYGGKVRNPKELSSLQDEAASLQRRRAELEDEQLELMIEIEGEEAELAERQARLRQIELTWRADQAALHAEQDHLALRQAELEKERKDLRARVPAPDLATYDDLRRRTSGSPIAILKRGICQTCGVDVPTGVALAVERGVVQHECPTCGRLLLHVGE